MAKGRHHNNFHLLRLLAAAQVLASHTFGHLGLSMPPLVAGVLSAFPGVPIFFVISGFLVSESWQRTTFSQYAINRALRIFPGLWGCLAVSIFIAAVWGDVTVGAKWIAAQATIGQAYNPSYLRGFGTGVLNGSLWTIPVELQFYAALPAIYWLLKSNRALLAAIGAGAVLNVLYFTWSADTTLHKLAGITLPIYLYMFLMGVALQRNRDLIRHYLVGRLPLWLGVYVLVELAGFAAGLPVTGNLLNPASGIALALLTVSAAHARAIPLRHDFSYGLYLYHMPVVNAFVDRGVSTYLAAAEVACITFALALASWLLIEKPAMRLKFHAPQHHSLCI